jgi:hypothetical protein
VFVRRGSKNRTSWERKTAEAINPLPLLKATTSKCQVDAAGTLSYVAGLRSANEPASILVHLKHALSRRALKEVVVLNVSPGHLC